MIRNNVVAIARLIQNTVESFTSVWSSRWITAADSPRSVAWSRIGKIQMHFVAMPYSTSETQTFKITRIATISSTPTSELTAPIHANPRLTLADMRLDSDGTGDDQCHPRCANRRGRRRDFTGRKQALRHRPASTN